MDSLGGYRLIRKLGAGSRSDVFLGHAGESGAVFGARSAAVKVFRDTTSTGSIDAEIEALARLSSPHLVRLDDLAIAPDGRPALVLGRLGPTSVSRLLTSRGSIAAGEAVTILAPVVTAVRELHRVGVTHRRLRLNSVLFDASGAPAIAGFGHATVVGDIPDDPTGSSLTSAALDACDEVIGDLVDLRTMVRVVIESTPATPSRSDLLDWIARSDRWDSPATVLFDLVGKLFDFASGVPVEFAAGRAGDLPQTRRAAARPADTEIEAPQPESRRATVRPLAPVMQAVQVPDFLAPLVAKLVARVTSVSRTSYRAVTTTVTRRLERVRGPVWFGGVAASVLIIVALAVLPAGPGAGAPPPLPPSQPSPMPSAAADQRAGSGPARLGDDPVAAARELLVAREGCFRERSILCLDDVDQTGSAAWEADGLLVRQLQSGEAAYPVAQLGEPVLVERLGDSAILALDRAVDSAGAASSLLLVKGGSGWRIRDLILG